MYCTINCIDSGQGIVYQKQLFKQNVCACAVTDMASSIIHAGNEMCAKCLSAGDKHTFNEELSVPHSPESDMIVNILPSINL